MQKILVTGAAGFIGRNLITHLTRNDRYTVLPYDVDTGALTSLLKEADFIIHLAGVNRPVNESEFAAVNRDLTKQITEILEQEQLSTPILLASSVQALLDNPYGRSKLAAEACIQDHAKKTGARCFIFRLTNVFGKWCRPNYNSVVATFCHNIANDLPITVSDPQKELTLIHVDEVARLFQQAIEGTLLPDESCLCSGGKTFTVTLGRLETLIRSFRQIADTAILPDFSDEFTRILYSVYLSYLAPQQMVYDADMKTDPRGWLFECIKSPAAGQIFISKTKPGITRGNHFHDVKVEKFVVLQGEAEICLRMIDGTEILRFPVNGDHIQIVEILPGMTHNITNTGSGDLITLFWTPELFDKDNPDTFFLPVQPDA